MPPFPAGSPLPCCPHSHFTEEETEAVLEVRTSCAPALRIPLGPDGGL